MTTDSTGATLKDFAFFDLDRELNVTRKVLEPCRKISSPGQPTKNR